MRHIRCSRCGGRLLFRRSRCRHCGAPHLDTLTRSGKKRPWYRQGRYWLGVAGLVGLLFAGQQLIRSPAVAEWYADFALRNLSHQFSAVAPAESPDGAYYFCIRRAVKTLTPASSVETFPPRDHENTTIVGEARYRVETHFYEDRVTGERVQRFFTCEVRYAHGRWHLEELADLSAERVARAP